LGGRRGNPPQPAAPRSASAAASAPAASAAAHSGHAGHPSRRPGAGRSRDRGCDARGRSSTASKAAPASPPGPRRTTASPGPVTRDGPAGSGQGTLPISSKGSGQNSHSPAARSLRLTPATLAAEVAGTARTQKITAAGGSPPYTFAVSSGSLPPGLSLSAQGILARTPTTPGAYQFTVTAADSSAPP